MTTPKNPAGCSNATVCSSALDAVYAWMRGETEYPGDSYIIAAMDAIIREHIRQRHYGMDVLASSELDNAQHLIQRLRNHFSI